MSAEIYSNGKGEYHRDGFQGRLGFRKYARGITDKYLGNDRAGSWRALDSDHGSELRIWRQRAGFPLDVLGDLAVEASPRAGAGSARRFLRDGNDCDPLRAVRSRDQGYSGAKRIVLVFYLNYSGIDAGSRLEGATSRPGESRISVHEYGHRVSRRRRVRYSVGTRSLSPNTLTIYANLLLVLNLFLMANVHRPHVFLLVAAIAGAGWTLSSSELWIAGQRAMPDWARGRMNATIIMISQAATALGGAIWGAAAAKSGVVPTFLVAGTLAILAMVVTHVVLRKRLSIDFAASLNFEPASVTIFSHDLDPMRLSQAQDRPGQSRQNL